jgi:hypothetical protein
MIRLANQIVLAATILIVGAGRAYGGLVLFSTLGPNDAYDMSGSQSFSFSAPPPPLFTDFWFAMPFQVQGSGDYPFSSAVLPLVSTGDIASVEIQLLSSSGGRPGSILDSIPVTDQVSSTPALVTARSSTFPVLQGGATYFLAVDVRPQLTTTTRWGLGTISGNPRGPNVDVWDAVNSLPLELAGPSPVGFTIRAAVTAVPEPSTIVIVATGIPLALGLCWHGRRALFS